MFVQISSSSTDHVDLKSAELSTDNIKRLKAARIFTENSRSITSMDFDSEGKICVTASEDDSINVYDCLRGRHKKMLLSKKYGVHLTRFTHLSSNILYASSKGNDTIRYLSLHDNKFIRYFQGHQKKVVSLEMSPKDDLFISGAKDEDVRLWDLKSGSCVGHLEFSSGTPCLSYDPSGLVFAVGLQSLENSVRLYDVRKYEQGPFALFNFSDNFFAPSAYPNSPELPEWTGLKFSDNGLKILINTSGDVHYVMDAFNGQLLRRLVGHVGHNDSSSVSTGEVACFAPDRSQDGSIHVWDIETPVKRSDRISGGLDLKSMHVIDHHVRPTQVVRFNPKRLMLASGCKDLYKVYFTPIKLQLLD
ncbi:11951_t:CDS:2 [Entrophospora sp. SA101]|nr:11951_t:CDS:2 [Entrophospora sp. SA101]